MHEQEGPHPQEHLPQQTPNNRRHDVVCSLAALLLRIHVRAIPGPADHRSAKIQSFEQRIESDPDDADAAAGIVRYLDKSDHETRGMALRALGRVESDRLDEIQLIAPNLSHRNHYTRRDAILAVKDRGDEAVEILDEVIACLDDPIGIDVRVFAAEVLGS